MSREDAPSTAIPPGFEVRDNELCVAGYPVSELARQVGERAFYAYDSALMSERARYLREHLPADIDLHYAIKANPMPQVVRHMAGLTQGLDVASAAELAVALDTGIDPLDISFAGPGKSAQDLEDAVAAGVIIILESFTEMERVTALGERHGCQPPVAVRVNPDFELKSSGMKMGGGPRPFGVDAECVPELLQRIADAPLRFMGLHIFTGSQNLRAESLIEAHDQTFALAERIAASSPLPLQWLNIGGGLGIPYFPGEQPLALEPVCDNLRQRLADFRERYPQCTVVMELGRYLVAEAGVYVCRVSDRKTSRGQVYLITNGGLHHHLALSGNFGQVIRKNYPVCIGNRVTGESRESVNIVGPLCTPLDILGQRMSLPVADIDDLVVVFQSGAYGFTASPQSFLSHPPPREVFL